MAIAIDAIGGGQQLSSNTLSFSHTSAGSNRFFLIEVLVGDAGVGPVLSSAVTVGGVSATQLSEVTSSSGALFIANSLWYLVAPLVGAQTVIVTAAASVTVIDARSATYTGVDQNDYFKGQSGDFVNGSTTFSNTVTATVPNCWGVAAVENAFVEQIATSGCVFRSGIGGGGGLFDSNGVIVDSVPTTFNYETNPSTSVNWTGIMVALNPAASGAKLLLIPGR